jgi:hypothetical protein
MANRYWVGGTGTWDSSNTANWSDVFLGTGGFSVPTSADDVILYKTTPGTITIASGATANSVRLITSGGASVALGANFTILGNLSHEKGPLVLNNFQFTANSYRVNTAEVRSIEFGTGNITLVGSDVGATGYVWQMTHVTDFTCTGSRTVNLTYAGSSSVTIIAADTGASEANSLDFNITAGTYALSIVQGSKAVMRSLNFTGFAGTWAPGGLSLTLYGSLTLAAGMTYTNGYNVLTFANTSGIAVITSAGKVLGPITQNGPGGTVQLAAGTTTLVDTRTYTLTAGALDLGTNTATLSTPIFLSSNSNTRSIVFGTGNITITGSGVIVFDISTDTNLTYTGTPTINISSESGDPPLSVKGAEGNGFGVTNNAWNYNFTGNPTSIQIFGNMKNVDFTGFTGSWTHTESAGIYIHGSLKLVNGMTYSGNHANTGVLYFYGTGNIHDFTTANKQFKNIQIKDGILTLYGNLNVTSDCGVDAGEFYGNGYNVTIGGQFSSNQTSVRTLSLGGGTYTVGSWTWNTTNLTYIKSTSNIIIDDSNFSSSQFDQTSTHNNLTIIGSRVSSTITIYGSPIFNTLSSTKTMSWTLIFQSGVAGPTITNWNINGSSGKLVTLNSSSSGTRATLTKSGGGTINANYINIKDIEATPSSTWYATNSVDSGNNLGWTFNVASPSYFLMF